MQLNGMQASIIDPQSTWKSNIYAEDREGYVYLNHKDVYAVFVKNGTREDNAVQIKIDGKVVGRWKLEAWQSATIERGVDDEGRFTFYEINSVEAQQSELSSVAKNDLGLIEVTFVPEKITLTPRTVPVSDRYSGSKGMGSATKGGGGRGGSTEIYLSRGGGQSVDLSSQTRSAGGTGLSGRSTQQFGEAEPMDLDHDRATVINLRLVAKPKDEPRPLRAINSVVSNTVPPPVS